MKTVNDPTVCIPVTKCRAWKYSINVYRMGERMYCYLFDFRYTGSGRSNACLSVVGRIIIWV